MKSLLFTIILGIIIIGSVRAQKIESKKVFGGYEFYQEESPLSAKQLESKMESVSEAYVILEEAKMNRVMSTVLNYAGGFLIGWPVGTHIAGGDPNWKLAAIGAGAVVLAIPLSISYSNKMKKVVDIYNASIASVGYRRQKPSLKFVAGVQGFGLRLVF